MPKHITPVSPPVTRLLTHNGAFHADDVLATVVLSTLWPDASLIRTRDRDTVAAASSDLSAVVYDVGGNYAPMMRNFDHHQPDPPRRADGTPFSAFGLVWQACGAEWLRRIEVAAALVSDTHAELDAGVVLAIDQIDNGCVSPQDLGPVGALTLPALIGDLVPEDDDPEELAAGFETALALARQVLQARAHQVARGHAARNEVAALIAAQADDPVLELPRGMPFARAVQAEEGAHLRFVLHPRAQDWVLYAIESSDGARELRCPFPQTWSALENEALAAASGVADAVFCHRNRFLAVARSRTGAREMAMHALIARDSGSEKSPKSME
ncbi:MYG1 family protein [Rhodobacteraceae bacterium 2376]|uniref:MYG1 family protein n=1 Tax=Rhabdonatronobacter sediminivivens TaxID=2743469 RepID=A0A7Z0KZB6_9RHOB|nr:MYG1 family protein [Rhabdonatronobacter sediminivivens]NYS26045.1 MYG1 family protein [Rhabdonatronobacter sediminivivens]